MPPETKEVRERKDDDDGGNDNDDDDGLLHGFIS
jgi:hypothetical protein